MQFCPKNREDISRYYRQTYIKLHEFGDQLFFIESVDALKITGTHESGDRFCIYLNDETPYEMDYLLPHKSFFQLDKNAVLLQRSPAKQYLRGLAPTNTTLTYLRNGQHAALDIGFEVLKAFITKGEWPTLAKAWAMQDKLTVALSSRMMLNRNNRQLYIDFTPVATVNFGKATVDVRKHLFFDEVVALLESKGELGSWEVKKYTPTKKETDEEAAAKLASAAAVKKKKFSPQYAAQQPVFMVLDDAAAGAAAADVPPGMWDFPIGGAA